MYPTASGFLFLYGVALVNLCLGFAVACRLGYHPLRGRVAPSRFRLAFPTRILPLKLFGRRQAADKAEESTEVIGLRTDLQPATREAAPEQSLTLKQAVEPIREELLRMTEVFRNLASKLSGHAGSEQHQITDLGTESDAAIQQLLRQINRAMDGLRSMAVESPEEIATREVLLDDLDASWTRCNAFACQLMMLSFDEDSAGAAVEQLAAVIGQAEDACRQYHGTLGSALRALG